jgi:hypothetical protein
MKKALTSFCFRYRYDPSKYAGRDEDDSDMEADFATIEMEEKRRYLFIPLNACFSYRFILCSVAM